MHGATIKIVLYRFLKAQVTVLRSAQCITEINTYRSDDKSLARPGRKQARKHVRDARDFNNMETRAVINFFLFFLQGKAQKEIHAILAETLAFSFLLGLRTYQHPCTFS